MLLYHLLLAGRAIEEKRMRSFRTKGVVLLITLCGALTAMATAGAFVGSCTSATYTDMYFGSDAGADFAAPPREAGADGDDGTGDAGGSD
jgi:hypothetical protein